MSAWKLERTDQQHSWLNELFYSWTCADDINLLEPFSIIIIYRTSER